MRSRKVVCQERGRLEPLLGKRALSLSELRLHNAGQALWFVAVVSQNPKGPIQENAHVPSPYHLLPPQGISFPLLFPQLLLEVRCPGPSLKTDSFQNVSLFTSRMVWGEILSPCTRSFSF